VPSWVSFPHQENPASELSAVLVLEMLNPKRRLVVECSDILAVHKCMGILPAERIA
jgi:hypothetical protein